jgi:hypothetical protein
VDLHHGLGHHRATDSGVVVHSSWRALLPPAQLQSLLGPLGHRFLGSTDRQLTRWPSIAHCVTEHGLSDTQWLVLDDLAHEFPEPPPPQLVLCDSEEGVWNEDVRHRVGHWARAWAQPS